jgi:hypothetical protein
MLAKRAEFFPFGARMRSDGQIALAGAYDGKEHPPSQALIDLLTSGFRQEAASGEIRAAGICYDVLTTPPGEARKCDAICVSLEHQSGEGVDVFVPYRKAWFGRIRYEEIFASRRTLQFFVPSDGTA